ncbi:MAG: tetratricopeptide repeat protein [Acidobacteriota bacterium]|nr:MAG: tetratricopeptide repeat protein [Acidobacteriota bacterium]
MQLYSEGDFQAAAQHLDQLPKTPDNNFFLGVCLYLNTEHERAAEIFTDIILSSPRWADAARWYRANIYLRQSNPHQALDSLEQLIQGETEFAEEAKTLSRKIEEGLRNDSSRQMERDEIDTRKP